MDETLKLFIKYILVRDLYESVRILANEERKHQGFSKHEDLLAKLREGRQMAIQNLAKAIDFNIDIEFTGRP